MRCPDRAGTSPRTLLMRTLDRARLSYLRSRPCTAEVETLVIFALIFSTDTGSAQVGAGAPRSSRCTTELASATRAEGSDVDRRLPARPSEIRLESHGLSLLRPYAPGKVPVVLVDGLWGSPRQWSRMVKALEADASVSERYQFLTFDYSTGDPIPYSAYMLRRAIGDLRDRLDPDRSNPAWNRMVLIGHSMGGLLCKMMTQDSGSKLWDLMTGSPFENLAGPAKARELLHGSLVFKPIPEVRRLIFIATPHRGSPLVWGPIRDRDPTRAAAHALEAGPFIAPGQQRSGHFHENVQRGIGDEHR